MKTLSFTLLILALAAGPLFATGEQDATAGEGPPVVTFFQNPGHSQRHYTTTEDIIAYQVMEERLGINIEWTNPSDHNAELSIMIASGDMTDLVQSAWSAYSGGIQKAYDDGLIMSLDDSFDAGLAPNYVGFLETVPEFRRTVVNDNGQYLGFMRYDPDYVQRPYIGLMVRQDWLDAVGLEMPETIDEWWTAWRAFKSEGLVDDDGYVFGSRRGLTFERALSSSYGVLDRDFMLDPETGRVVYSRVTDAYRDYMEALVAGVEEGLIDPEGLLMDVSTHQAAVINSEYGMTYVWENHFPIFNDPGQEADPNYNMVAAPYPVHSNGKRYASWNFDRVGAGHWTTVTADSPVVEAALRWVDYGYSQEGADLLNWGVLGESYDIVNGQKEYIVPVADIHKWAKSDNGTSRLMDVSAAFAAYTPFNLEQTRVWREGSDYDLFLPDRITYTSAESARMANLMTDIKTYTQETIEQILLGVQTMDVWDEYVATLERMGVAEVIEMTQAAYDRYNARL